MATSTIPTSNPAGNNQTTPKAGGIQPIATPGTVAGTGSSAQQNPYVPITPGSVIGAPATGPTPVPGSTNTNQDQTQKQLSDIYGEGVGTDLTNLLGSIGGTDSATLEEYIKSLAPQEATAHANLNTSLGASGVDPNSSVAAIGNANLEAQMFSSIAGESANLTQSGQNLEASILTGMEPAAAAEVASSGWDVFGQVLDAAGNLAGDIVGTGGVKGLFGK